MLHWIIPKITKAQVLFADHQHPIAPVVFISENHQIYVPNKSHRVCRAQTQRANCCPQSSPTSIRTRANQNSSLVAVYGLLEKSLGTWRSICPPRTLPLSAPSCTVNKTCPRPPTRKSAGRVGSEFSGGPHVVRIDALGPPSPTPSINHPTITMSTWTPIS